MNELDCESTSLDPYAYTWKAPENCILSVLKEDYAHKLKNDNHYYIVSQNTSENKYLFQVKNHPQRLCNKPTDVKFQHISAEKTNRKYIYRTSTEI